MKAKEALEHAMTMDQAGCEEEAFEWYNFAFENATALDEGDEKKLYIGYASTCRNIGNLARARKVLDTGLAKYSSDPAILFFSALLFLDQNSPDEAVSQLMQIFANIASIDGQKITFARSIEHYSKVFLTAIRP